MAATSAARCPARLTTSDDAAPAGRSRKPPHPRTRFVRNLVAIRLVGEDRFSLFNASLSVRHQDGGVDQRTLADADDRPRRAA